MDSNPSVQQRGSDEITDLRQQLAQVKSEFAELQQSLYQNEALYRAIVEDQTDLICRFMPDARLTFVNLTYCQYFNKTLAESITHSFMPLIPDEDRGKVKQALAAVTVANPVIGVVHRVIAPDGQLRQFHWVNRGIYNEANELIEYQSVGRDITGEIEARNALERRAKRLHLLYRIVSQTDQPIEAQINHALCLCTQFLGMEMGVVSHVADQEDEQQHVPEYVYVVEGICPASKSYPLGQTYCEIVLHEKQAIAIAHVGHSIYNQYCCHMATGVEAYIGIPVLVDGEQYGALSFTSRAPKLDGFTPGDIEFVELLAFWIGAALQRRNQEAELLLHRAHLEKLVEKLIAKTLPTALSAKFILELTQVVLDCNDKISLTNTLTTREHDVLQCIVAGSSNKQIADQLIISLPTVKYHVGNLLDKLGAVNRTEAAAIALREGFVSQA